MDQGPTTLILVVLGLALVAGLFFVLTTTEAPEPQPIDGPPVVDPGPGLEPDEPLLPGAGPILEGAGDPGLPAEGPAVRPALPDDTVLFKGKVIDASKQPAPGASISVLTLDGAGPTTTSADDGTFAFRMAVTDAMVRQWGTVRAEGADGTLGSSLLSFGKYMGPGTPPEKVEGEVDVGPIVLGEAHAFDVRVWSKCPDGLPATLELVSARLGLGAPPWAKLATDADGKARIEGVPKGRWRLVASAAGCGRAWSLVELPRATSDPVEIELPEAHTVTVLVRDGKSQAPIAGAALEVSEQLVMPDYYTRGPLISVPSTYTTDADGRVRITGLGGKETLYLRAAAEGYPMGSEHGRGRGSGPGEAIVRPGVDSVTIDLARPMTVRWPLEDKGHGIPADGTEVRLKPWTNTGRITVPEKGVIESGELVVEGWGPDGASGYAHVPGMAARLSARANEEKGWPTAFYPLRKIEVRVTLPGGTPAKGWYLMAHDGGNNPVVPPVQTDAAGYAVMKDLYGGPGSLVNVRVADVPGYGGYSKALGSVNLQQQDGSFEVEIPGTRTVHVRATVEGGAPPEGLEAMPQLNYRVAKPAEESGEAGYWVLEYRPTNPEGTLRVSLMASSYNADVVEVPLAGTADPIEVTVDLKPAATLNVRVIEPADKRYKIGLQHWNDAESTWEGGGSGPGFNAGGSRANPNGIVTRTHLKPGRYRAIDTNSGITSDAVEVVPGVTPNTVSIDLGKCGWVKGRIEVPEGADFSGFSVGEVGAEPRGGVGALPGMGAIRGRPVNHRDGTFWYRVPGTRPITLRLYHALLRPHPTKGSATVTKPQEGVRLTAVRGPVATLRLDKAARVYVNPGRARPVTVHLYTGEVEGEGTKLTGLLNAGHRKIEIGGYEPGTYTVWVDVPGFAPVVMKNTKLGDGDTDLGEVALADGATLRLDVKVAEGQSPPRFSVWVTKVDAPSYTRNVDMSGETIRLQGLGAGRFRVHVTAYNGAAPGIDEEIEFDGATEVVRTIDAR